MIKKFENSKFLWFFGPLILGVILVFRTTSIVNPFVYPDETAYINLIARIANNFDFDAAQYPPLYPFLASFFYNAKDLLASYELIRLFNVFVFSLTFIPIFAVAKIIIEAENKIIFLFGLAMVLLPWSSLITPIWAEPLYFLIFNTTVLLALKSFQTQKYIFFLATGLTLGLLFLTKQAGIILGIGFVMSQFLTVINNRDKKKALINGVCALAPFIVTIFLYKMLNQSSDGQSGIGYSNVVNAMVTRFMVILFKFDFYQSFFHQVSYVTLATFYVGFFGMLYLYSEFRKLDTFKRNFLIFISLTLFGFMVFIAIFNNTVDVAYKDANEPTLGYGRYLVASLPSIFVLGLLGFKRLSAHRSRNWVIGICIILFIILGRFTPFHSAWASGIVGNPDVTYLCQIFQQDFPPWNRAVIDDNLGGLPWTLSFIFTLVSLTFVFLHRRWPSVLVIVIFLAASYTGAKNHGYATSMASFLRDENNVYKYFVEKKIDKTNVLFFEDYSPGIYVSQFWYGFFDFAKWSRESRIYKKDLLDKNPNIDVNKYVLAAKADLAGVPAIIEFDNARLFLVKDLMK